MTTTCATPLTPPSSTRPVTTIGKRYLLLGTLGSGAMSVVYRARDLETNTEVAVKVLRPAQRRIARRRARFLREGRLASRPIHPRAVRVREVVETETLSYLVMDLVDGPSLREALGARGAQSERTVARLLVQVASLLEATHANGIVHRDLKPDNLLLDAAGDVHLIDFGIAHSPGAADGTQPGTVLGTLGYLSPEQARGEEVDARSDFYTLGIIALEALCGRRLFTGRFFPEKVRRLAVGLSDPMAQAGDRLPAALLPILRRCLAFEPDERYASAWELLADLEALGFGVEGSALPELVSRGSLPEAPSSPAFAAAAIGRPSEPGDAQQAA